MKKLCAMALAAVLAVSSVFAADRDEDYIRESKEHDPEIWALVDGETVIRGEYTNYRALENGDEPQTVFFCARAKDSDDWYMAGFEHGVYRGIYKNLPLFSGVKYFDPDEAKAFAKKNGLGEVTGVMPIYLSEGAHMYAYFLTSGGEKYIIPYYITDYSEFNIMDSDECRLEVGTAYTVDEFCKISERESELHMEYSRELYEKKKRETDYEYFDPKTGEDVVHEAETDEVTDKKTDGAQKEDPEEEPEKEPEKKPEKKVEKEPEKLKNPEFTDVPKGHWAYGDVTALAAEGVIKGYPDGHFGADDQVTYEQLALLLKRQFGYMTDNAELTPAKRGDVIVALVKALGADVSGVDESVTEKFSDAKLLPEGDRRYIAYAVGEGLVLGYGATLDPEGAVTRAQVAALINRAKNMK